ncbi:hypothetical protein [Spirosoma rhododendri]|uniref:Uncharacterized protein n=1 Tax=Spirosoma rhododendri TaxID=2728024 RepID=A0A7L5DMM7_9BACT|nr:hypothetical protein [Spirosoma rhododendri]QJD77698.1 hypothetical protein HH216_04145 [Spirosoma rhododendri]
MNSFFTTLRQRNPILSAFGWICLISAVVCVGLMLITNVQVLGINAFVKPVKFFLSSSIFVWTMGWLMGYLRQQRSVRIYSWAITLILAFELVVVVVKAGLGQLSHFNVKSATGGILFSLMGVAITIAILWTLYIAILFLLQRPDELSGTYLWGIRLGMLIFIVFAFEGGMMAARLAHTVGAPDGGAGLPGINWSTQHGDLRIAHFFGMHALQLIPLFGYYIARRPFQTVLFAIVYVGAVSWVLLEALAGRPLIAGL